jgi:signal transduction histidine kinase/CheY-like chemotaxis protein/HPt (histidine-containing phosphotransfer) domain-containing protein
VALTRLEVLGAPLPSQTPYWLLDRINVDYNASIVSLDFGALDFTSPKRNKLAYRIAGLSDRWIELDTQHRITLTNLDAGDHLLEVRAANADSVWSDPPLKLIVHRDAAPWRSPAAYAAYAFILLLLVCFCLRMTRTRLARMVEAKERLETQVALRTRELLDSNRQLEEASRAKSSFLARMSHELRTPMNGVVGSTELLARTLQSSKQRRLTDTIRSSARVLLQIVDDLLDLSKMQAGKLHFESIEFDLGRLAEECATLFAGTSESKAIALVMCPPRELILLKGDELRIRQILMNLVGNAVKFTSKGEVTVKIDIDIDDSRLAKVLITVSDTGIGMDSSAIQRIFEPFTQADESTTRRFGGSGLGLAICRELAERMGGRIEVDSKPGVGSVFRVNLPLQIAAASSHTVPGPSSRAYVRIMTHRRSLHEALTRHALSLGYAVVAEDAGEPAVAHSPCAVIADLGTHEAFIRARLDAGISSAAPLVIVATAEQFEQLQVVVPANRALIVHTPVHRIELSNALHTALHGGSSESAIATQSVPHPESFDGHVLLVEDEPVNAVIAQGYLSELGCTNACVTSGAEAVARCLTERFDLVMMDLNMPGMDGFATAKLIRQHEANHRRVPIAALTAHDEGRYREICLQSGMDDVLSKPYTLEQFANLLRRWLAKPAAPRIAPETAAEWIPLAVVDPQSIAGLRHLQAAAPGSLFAKLVVLFRQSSREAIAQLNTTLERADFVAAGAVCHKLAAASANVGARNFGREVRRLERACAFKDADLALEITEQLGAALPTLCAELVAFQLRESA